MNFNLQRRSVIKLGEYKWTREPVGFKNENGKVEMITKQYIDFFHFPATKCLIIDSYY